MSHPQVSIIIASYKRSGYLYHQLKSLKDHLTYPNYEIIISDDGSGEDELRKRIAQKFNATLLLNEHKGMGATFNSAIRAAESKYLLHLEDDWFCTQDCLIDEIKILETWDDIGCVRVARSAQRESLPIEEFRNLNGLSIQIVGNQPPLAWCFNGAPRLQRKDIYETIGYYREDVDAGNADVNISKQYLAHCNLKVAFLKRSFRHFGHHSSGDWRTGTPQELEWKRKYKDEIPVNFVEKKFKELKLL